MDLTPYVERLRSELAVAAEAGGEDARTLAERLTAPLESAVRLVLLEALSAAAGEITRELAPGSVEVRLRGAEPGFAITLPPTDEAPAEAPEAAPRVDTARLLADDSGTSRINLRLPDALKSRVEEAAAREGLSINAWLVRAAAAALEPGRVGHRAERPATKAGQRYTGWVR